MNEHVTAKKAARVAVGMSGGLDSSVAAALLQEDGHDVIGLTLSMFRDGSRCCSLEDIERARRVCAQLGIRHCTLDAIEAFDVLIVQPFVRAYASGHTPSPCVVCNQFIKFGIMQRRAREMGCEYLATGHYARVEHGDGSWQLLRARDRAKDQSYFLHRLSQDQLSHSLFPLASRTKEEAAEYAAEKGLAVADRSVGESQDLCFVPADGHASFVEQRRPELARRGPVVDATGRQLGEHGGFHRFTVGQRKGLGVAAPARLYVKEVDPGANRVVVGTRSEVMAERCRVEDVHWIAGEPAGAAFACDARIRYRHEPAAAQVEVVDATQVHVRFKEPQFAVTPGQAAVFYDGDEVIGGGWIATPEGESQA